MGFYRGPIGRMEKKMETTIMGCTGMIIGYMLGFYRDNGKENGSYHNRSNLKISCFRRLDERTCK